MKQLQSTQVLMNTSQADIAMNFWIFFYNIKMALIMFNENYKENKTKLEWDWKWNVITLKSLTN